nr:NADH dehydrogenase subunit 8 [Rhynchopus humris]
MDYIITSFILLCYHASRSITSCTIAGTRWVRGEHALATDREGGIHCIACKLCAAVCPAFCISVASAISVSLSRSVSEYSLCTSRCISCSACDNVCPLASILHREHIMSTSMQRPSVSSLLKLMV